MLSPAGCGCGAGGGGGGGGAADAGADADTDASVAVFSAAFRATSLIKLAYSPFFAAAAGAAGGDGSLFACLGDW